MNNCLELTSQLWWDGWVCAHVLTLTTTKKARFQNFHVLCVFAVCFLMSIIEDWSSLLVALQI